MNEGAEKSEKTRTSLSLLLFTMDRKRVTGPELSVQPLFKNSTVPTKDLLNEKNRRRDDRTVDDLRPICKCLFA